MLLTDKTISLENCHNHILRKQSGMRILQGIILQLGVEIIMQIIRKHWQGLQDFQSPLDAKIISVSEGWMNSSHWLPLSVCSLILMIYKQPNLFAFFSMLVQAVYDLLFHRVGMRFFFQFFRPWTSRDRGFCSASWLMGTHGTPFPWYVEKDVLYVHFFWHIYNICMFKLCIIYIYIYNDCNVAVSDYTQGTQVAQEGATETTGWHSLLKTKLILELLFRGKLSWMEADQCAMQQAHTKDLILKQKTRTHNTKQ